VSRILEQSWFSTACIVILTIGVLVVAYTGFQYVRATLDLQDNLAYKELHSEDETDLANESVARMLFAADRERIELEDIRSSAMIFGGAGLVAIAIGWIGLDFVRSQRKKKKIVQSPDEVKSFS
jgi:Na+-translocating ferredoxin:NAD+ oxidoreductase RnfA subunit